MRQLKDTELKDQIFRILCDFAEFCDANHLRYYLCGGTLLGAIRHKGFIPWDDDVDLLMPRPDFDRMHELVRHNPIKPFYRLIGYNADKGYWPFAKLIDVRTKVINEYSTADKHLWIDIFPMDGLPDDIEESNRILSYAAPHKVDFVRAYARMGKGKNITHTLGKIPVMLYLKLIGIKKTAQRIDSLARQLPFEESEYVGGIAWSLGPKERMRREDYVPIQDVEFNGRMFHAPACWELYLKQIYGNYMELPPVEKRVNHSNVVYMKDEYE